MEIYFCEGGTYPAGGVQTNGPDAMKFVSMILGALLIFCGNIMPKAGRNAVFGLRTRWSMKNDRVWQQQSQRFCGGLCRLRPVDDPSSACSSAVRPICLPCWAW